MEIKKRLVVTRASGLGKAGEKVGVVTKGPQKGSW